MSKPKEVFIDGVRYVPASQASHDVKLWVSALLGHDLEAWGPMSDSEFKQHLLKHVAITSHKTRSGRTVEDVVADAQRFSSLDESSESTAKTNS